MAGVDFAILRSQISIIEVLGLIGYHPLEKSDGQWRGPCPIHESSSPTSRSFSVCTERNLYQCFKCGSRGNQLDLWAALSKRSLFDASIDLCKRLGREIPVKESPHAPPDAEQR